MRTRDRVALSLPSLLLRVMLAVTFLWAGLSKLLSDIELPGPVATRLGLVQPAAAPLPPPQPPSAVAVPLPDPKPADSTQQSASPTEPTQASEADTAASAPAPRTAAEASQAPTASVAEAAGQPAANPETQPALPPPTVTARRMMGLGVLIQNSAAPLPDAAGNTPRAILPAGFAASPWPVSLAWAATITEIMAGLFLLLGLLTRPAALALAGVMLTAMWLTEIGPAIQSGQTLLGFLPDRDPADLAAWTRLLWQFALFMAALAAAFLGSGPTGVDHRLFAPPADLFEPPPPRGARRSKDETIP